MNWESIITRIIETPVMNKKELAGFIKNNIEEYFSVNMNEYLYDYEVISLTNKDKMTIMLAVVPRIKLKQVLDFIKYCGLVPQSIGIYPDSVSNLFLDEDYCSIAVIDANVEKTTLTILDKGKIFLYSNILNETEDEDFSDLMRSIDYFFNFYSTRHFGSKIDKIYVLGELCTNSKLCELISTQTSIETNIGFNIKASKLIKKSTVDENIYPDILGDSIPVKNIYNKSIDFLDRFYRKNKKKQFENKLIIHEIELFFLITIIIIGAALIYTKLNLLKYDTLNIDSQIAALSGVQNDVNKLDKENKAYEDKANYIKKIEGDDFDYIGVLETLRNGLPKDVTIKAITMDKQNINVVFDVEKNTIDAARLIVAINSMNAFEPVELPQVDLNDNVKEVTLKLKLLESYKGVNKDGKK
ncbi:hypothetical protein [Clostridium sp. AWRP]|uniref:type IV pilus biogenesis protein PilM n=1 Tax=Clostridium sp. AWRP TaxID=2212991 RepID=UPI001FAA123C|nr:hypothetical protein [Clostridium sp. AWRP]